MFTGLIEEIGNIKSLSTSNQGCVLVVGCKKILDGIKLGDSICVNGVCQTVTSFGADFITTELSNETINVTNFKSVKSGQKVNLERAMTLAKRLDGHLVNGHVDCTARFLTCVDDGFSKNYSFEIGKDYAKYVAHKGSITVNGVSLTVSKIDKNVFSVAVIPTTLKDTNLYELKIGDFVNIETDIIAKYVENFLLLNNNTSKIDKNLLEMNGFL